MTHVLFELRHQNICAILVYMTATLEHQVSPDMITIRKTFKYRLYKNRRNKHLHRQIDVAGIIWNHCGASTLGLEGVTWDLVPAALV